MASVLLGIVTVLVVLGSGMVLLGLVGQIGMKIEKMIDKRNKP